MSPTVLIVTPFFLQVFQKMVPCEKNEKTIIRKHHTITECDTSLVEARIGSPLMAMDVEIMIALGGIRFLYLAFAGSIHEDIIPGDIFITRGALNETAIPHLYGFHESVISPHSGFTDIVIERARKTNMNCKTGLHWCTDAPYRETWGKVKKYRHEGALCVEMEGSALFSVCNHYGVPAAAIYVITDVVGEKGWQQSWHTTEVLHGCKEVIGCVMSLLKAHPLTP